MQQINFPRARLYRPPANVNWVARPRLLEKLDQVLRKPVALISALAGFGKTALLKQRLDRPSGISLFVFELDYNV